MSYEYFASLIFPRAIAGPIRVSVDTSKIIDLPLSCKGQIIGKFRLTDCGDIGAFYTLYNILVLHIYGLTGLSAGAGEVRRLCCNRL